MEKRQLGKYQLLKRLGAGGMAEVFLAKTSTIAGFEKTVALKCILPHCVEDPESIQSFLNEARVAARLTHSNIAQIYDLGEADGTYFIAMEHIDGPSVRALWEKAQLLGVPVPPGVAVRIVADACQGLAFAHEYADAGMPLMLVHRDVNPENVLLSRAGTVKIADFGIARSNAASRMTQLGVIKGKLWYMPLEQLLDQALDCRVDVYALGVTFYELLTGRLPYDAEDATQAVQVISSQAPVPVHEVRRDLPKELWPIVAKAMAPQKEDRYQDCRAFNLALERYLVAREQIVTAAEVAEFIDSLERPVKSLADTGRTEIATNPGPDPSQSPHHPQEPKRKPAPTAAPPAAAPPAHPPAREPAHAAPQTHGPRKARPHPREKPAPAPAPAPLVDELAATTPMQTMPAGRSPWYIVALALGAVVALAALGASAWRFQAWRAARLAQATSLPPASADPSGAAGAGGTASEEPADLAAGARPDASAAAARPLRPKAHRDAGTAAPRKVGER